MIQVKQHQVVGEGFMCPYCGKEVADQTSLCCGETHASEAFYVIERNRAGKWEEQIVLKSEVEIIPYTDEENEAAEAELKFESSQDR